MRYNAYCLFNKATDLYEGIMLYRSDVVACRSLELTLEKNPSLSASDFVLYHIGAFDNETAEFESYSHKRKVDFVPRSVPEEEKMSDKPPDNSVIL